MREKKYRAEYESEAALCAAFIKSLPQGWTAYPETAGFDIVLVRDLTGEQIGIEAKLTLNAKVILQVLPEGGVYARTHVGPDFRAVLVPYGFAYGDLRALCERLGLAILELTDERANDVGFGEWGRPWHAKNRKHPCCMALPDRANRLTYGGDHLGDHWHDWCPDKRLELPDYVPDVACGVAGPMKLSPWKVKAIKVCVLLDKRGFVTRADFRALQINDTIWTNPSSGWLDRGERRGTYVRGALTPDFRAQHPTVYEQCTADFDTWAHPPTKPPPEQLSLQAGGAT